MRLLLAFALACAIAGPAAGQDDPLAHFDAYQAAMEEGRVEDAVAAGLAAWRAAETAWGDSRETAVLAFNVASLQVRLGNTAEAVEPASRALELAGVAQGDVPPKDAALVLGLAEFGQSGGAQGADRLLDALQGRGDEPAEIDDLVAYGWINVAIDARQQGRRRPAAEYARAARVAASRLGPDFSALIVEAASIEAVAAIEDGEWADARAAYLTAIEAYPADANPATDERLATLMAWETATRAVLETQFQRQRRTGTNFRPRNENELLDESPVRQQEACYAWVEPRRKPVFPVEEEFTGNYGAVLVTYDVSRSGALENVRVAATAPSNLSEAFVREIMEDVPSWRASVPPDAVDACLKNQVISFQFYFQ